MSTLVQLLTGSVTLPVHRAGHEIAIYLLVTGFSLPIFVTVTFILESASNDVTNNLVKYIYFQSNLVLLVTISNGSE